MSEEIRTSETLLSRLKERVHLQRQNPHASFITVTANEMLALVECAEAGQRLITKFNGGGLVDVNAVVDEFELAVKKLEAL